MGLVRKRDGTGFYSVAKTKVFKERQDKKKVSEKTEAAGTKVGAVGVDAVSEKDNDQVIKKNLDEQSKLTGVVGRRVTGGLSRFA